MRNAFEDVLKLAGDHPLIALGLLAFLFLALLLGTLDELEFIGEVLLVGVRHAKVRLLRLRVLGQRFRDELRTWDVEEPAKRVDGVSPPSSPSPGS
jgi:hypothetical protein